MKINFGTLLVAGTLLAGSSVDAVQPYDSINLLPQIPYFVQDGYVLLTLADQHHAEVAIDVESEDGGVARYLAQQANNLPSLRQVYSVNPWSHEENSHLHLYRRFLSNVIHENTTEIIIPIRMSSHEASEALTVKAGFISLVGSNNHETISKDILSWYSHLSDNGVICGNNWNEVSVQSGVTQAAMLLNVPVQVNGNVWYFVKN